MKLCRFKVAASDVRIGLITDDQQLEIMRGGNTVFAGETRVDKIKRPFTELVEYLFRSQESPDGAGPVDRSRCRPAGFLYARSPRFRADHDIRYWHTGELCRSGLARLG